jgi:hypothetical protein
MMQINRTEVIEVRALPLPFSYLSYGIILTVISDWEHLGVSNRAFSSWFYRFFC